MSVSFLRLFIYLLLNFWKQNVMLQHTVFGKIILFIMHSMLSCVAENVPPITMKELSHYVQLVNCESKQHLLEHMTDWHFSSRYFICP